ncbi:hypothetical protein LBMAG49_09950 [Planctomycetota bacterium]|nr:PEP-CTERM sorting domain-containing protein [Planctomycetota bacterium]GDY01666.1 hypothetical protein LBMAG49_09950 [Planctomycetota bacterium]
MRLKLILSSLLLSLSLASCADHSGGLIAFDSPQFPVVPGDEAAVTPIIPPGGGGGGGGGTGGGGGGAGPGSPVPEPGTMLLVGSGFAAAAFLRRRRQPQVTA